MNRSCVRVTAALVALLLISIPVFAQEKEKYKAATLDGVTGLFKIWDAESLRHGETNFTFGYDRFNRDPGQLQISRIPAGAAVGLFDRLELFGSIDVQRDIEADNISFYRLLPGQLPIPSTTPQGFQLFSNDAPYMDVPEAMGRGDINLGLKFNIVSEFRGDPVSVAIGGTGKIPGQRNIVGLNRGLSNGAFEGGIKLAASKTAADFIRFHFNAGMSWITDSEADDVTLPYRLQDKVTYGAGVEFPTYKPYRFIAEVGVHEFYELDSDAETGINPNTPVDVILGGRVYPKRWLSFGAGYQMTLNRMEDRPLIGARQTSMHGFVVQGTIGTRRNDPPTVTCAVQTNSILQDDKTTIRANAVDPDGDNLTFTWTSTGGKVSGTGDTATFDATNVAPGKYTVTVVVSDGKHEVSCSTEITVLKRNVAPTARVEPSTFDATQGDTVTLRCIGSDQNNDALTYSWTVNGEKLAATEPQIQFGTEGRKPGSYTVVCTVSDGEATGTAQAAGTVRERVRPNQPPTIECQTTSMDVEAGGTIELRARATDPDGDQLSYSWTSTGGSVSGTGETATFNAAGIRAGSYTVTVTVDDGRGGKASCSMTVFASERISVTRDNCGFFAVGGTRVDNCAKAILDDVAVRMRNDSALKANIIGYTDGSRMETGRRGLGERRAKAMAAYLQKQGIDSSRLTITDGGSNNPVGDNKTAAGRKLNRRVEIELSAR